MASQHTFFQRAPKFAVAVPAFAATAVFSGSENQAASPLCLLVGTAEKYAVRLLLDLVPAAWQAFQGCAFGDSHWSSFSVAQLLVTGWHILGRLLGAA